MWGLVFGVEKWEGPFAVLCVLFFVEVVCCFGHSVLRNGVGLDGGEKYVVSLSMCWFCGCALEKCLCWFLFVFVIGC